MSLKGFFVIEIGKYNKLPILKFSDYGAFLDAGENSEILLPNRDVPEQCDVGDLLDVFVCYDSEDRLVATTQKPLAQVGQFAHLMVKSVESVGAFLDWGLPKDLFLPFSEQSRDLRMGHFVVVYIYIDKSDRISSSMRLDRHIDKEKGDYKEGDEVSLMIGHKTDLGFKAIVNGRHWGVIYANEVFERLEIGQKLKGYIKKLREDGKIDLSLQKLGHKAAEDIGERILETLKQNEGFLPLNDKAAAEIIYDTFGVSKKKYKMAIGGLYKKRLITVDEDGIRLVKS
jgi:predicted RNA-binding protein (virulence factor B family)